jgi:hypothetical protein
MRGSQPRTAAKESAPPWELEGNNKMVIVTGIVPHPTGVKKPHYKFFLLM